MQEEEVIGAKNGADSLENVASPHDNMEQVVGEKTHSEGIIRWRLGSAAEEIPDTSHHGDNNNIVWKGPMCVGVAKSDSHPDMIADLISEFLTDTILRIDADASVDIQVSIKQDLILVTGIVGCSHPAKSAIIHSEQFFSTLNGSIREVLKDIGFIHPKAATPLSSVAVAPTTGSNSSPKKTPVAPEDMSAIMEADQDILLDPSTVHIILAITPYESSEGGGQAVIVARAKAGQHDDSLQMVARKIQVAISKLIPKSLVAGGLVVQIVKSSTGFIELIDASICSAGLITENLVKEISEKVLNLESLCAVTPDVNHLTLVQLRPAHRAQFTGRSSSFTGKDWTKPERYAHVLARLEAKRLIQTHHPAYTSVEIEIIVSPSLQVANELKILNVSLETSPPCSHDNHETLTRLLNERCMGKTLSEIRESFMTRGFFGLDCGGSLSSHESV